MDGKKIVLVALLVLAIGWLVLRSNGTPQRLPESGGKVSLFDAAKSEAVVNIWATNAEDLNWIPAAFSKAHPGIVVKVFTDLNVASRVITEAKAGRNDVDVVWNSEALVRPLIDRDLLIDNEWEKLGVRAEDVGADGHMAITSSMAFAIAYRKDVVAPSDVPKAWDQLVAAKYRGKMAASPVLFARLCAALGAFEGDAQWLSFARRFRGETQTLWSNDLLEQSIVSGERPYIVGAPYYLAERWRARGLSIEVVLPEPVFITQFGAVVLRKAPHPSAARLLASWLSGADGRAAREQALMAVDLRPSSTHAKAEALRNSGKRLFVDTREAMDARNKLIPEMDRIISEQR